MIAIRDLVVEVEGFRLEVPRLEVAKGEYLVVMGASGVGKTVLLLTIAGFYKPLKGSIVIDGVDVTRLPPERRGVALVPQDYGLWPNMTVYDNIALPLRCRGLSEEEVRRRVLWYSKLLGISSLLDRKPSTLSGGEKQRVALARALAVEPKLLLLDEPFSQLDPGHRASARRLLKTLHYKLRFTAIHVTHNLADAIQLASRIAFMEAGRIVGVMSVEEFLSTPYARPYIEEALQSLPPSILEVNHGLSYYESKLRRL